jgi:hypothetical protein
MMLAAAIKDQATDAMHWAASGSKLTYTAIGIGLVVAVILFRMFFKNVSGVFHCIGFSFGASGNPAVAAEPGLSTNSRLKLVVAALVPPAIAFAAYFLLPNFFPTMFK